MPKFWTVSLFLVCSFPLILLALGSLDARYPSAPPPAAVESGQAQALANLVKTASTKLGELEQAEVNLLSIQGEALKLSDKRREIVEELHMIDSQLSRFQSDAP